MASSKLTEGLQALFPTTDPAAAAKGPTGATVAKGRPPTRQPGEPNYLPLAVLAAAGALVVWAMLRPGPLLGRGLNVEAWQEPRQQPESYQGASYEENWPELAQEQ